MSKQYDDFFKLIVEDECECPSKDGASYEIISAAVFSILDKTTAIHDLHIAGLTEVKHQIDAVVDNKVLVEAKDKIEGKKNVGIGVARELQANLVDIRFSKEGYLVTNTGFSSNVEKFQRGIKKNPDFKPIHLFHIRTSNADDLKGRVSGFRISAICHRLVLLNLELRFKDHESNSWVLDDLSTKDLHYVVKNCFLNSNLNPVDLEEEIRDSLPEDFLDVIPTTLLPWESSKRLVGFLNSKKYFVKHEEHNYELDSIQYTYYYEKIEMVEEVKPTGKPCILVKSEDKKINKLITDTDLKQAILKVVKDSKEYKELLKDK